jgi:hypothetical protein
MVQKSVDDLTPKVQRMKMRGGNEVDRFVIDSKQNANMFVPCSYRSFRQLNQIQAISMSKIAAVAKRLSRNI